jgi:hypothetical protein
MYLVAQSKTPSLDERKTLRLYVFATETALALFWSINVIVFTPAPVEFYPTGQVNLYQVFWTDGRVMALTLVICIAIVATLLIVIVCERPIFLDLPSNGLTDAP